MAHPATLTSIGFRGVPGDLDAAERVRRNVERACEQIDEAALEKPDLIVLPETFNALGMGSEKWQETAETIPGPTTDALAKRARKYATHIVAPIIERRGNRLFNSAAIIGRKGEIVGVYNKMHPTVPEIEGGITPGAEAPAWETDLGKVGCAICFDLNFRDVAVSLAEHDADVVCFSSMYRGGLSTRIWAFDFGFWFISAIPGENAVILNPLGQVQKESFAYSPIITAHINLDAQVFHIDFNHQKMPDVMRKYGPAVEVNSISPEAVYLLTSHHPEVTVDDIAEEFGLERRDEYWQRSNRAREEALRQ